jgi:Fe-S-cluster containining protein
MDIAQYAILAKEKKKDNQKLVTLLKTKKPRDLDSATHQLHDAEFEKIDCLNCANCCKSISPIVTDKDIQRISKHLKKRPGNFADEYLFLDSDGDYVFKTQPCPFLGSDNYCSIYSVRPKACAEYPHTDRLKFIQIVDLSLKNTLVCPAVYEVFEGLKKKYTP